MSRRAAPHETPARRKARVRLAWLCAWVVAWVSATGTARPAYALDRATEAAAKQALALALKDHAAGDDDGALARLQKARRACGSSRCAPATRASVLRDLGALSFLRGNPENASALFAEALEVAPDLPWNAVFDAREVVDEWAAVKAERAALRETPPEGDFEHVPEKEQAVNTPLPVYAELNVTGVAKVVVKYRVPGETEFKRRNLPRFGGGWGGTIPCQDVKRGLLRYFLQAFDESGVPLANSGDVKHLFFVPIRWAIVSEPPHLPGQSPPEACKAGAPAEEEAPEAATGPAAIVHAQRYVHLWIGVAGSLDLAILPSATNVCALNTLLQPANSSFYCTNPDGSDFPTRSASASQPLAGKSGDSSGGVATGDVRVLVTLDYAVNTHFLTGVRAGYVAQSYPGAAASKDGHENLPADPPGAARDLPLRGRAARPRRVRAVPVRGCGVREDSTPASSPRPRWRASPDLFR